MKLFYAIRWVKQSVWQEGLKTEANTSHNLSLTSTNPHLFDLSCLHCAYTNKKWATA